MNKSTSGNNDHLLRWIAAALFLIGLALADIAITAWSFSLVTLWQLAASAVSYLLIGAGALFTIWQIRTITNRPIR
jgi:hypothetical protein